MKDPEKTEWSALYEAAIEFKREAPWQWMGSEEVFAIENPLDGSVAFFSFLGSGGEEFGVGVFLGERGLEAFCDVLSDSVQAEDILEEMVPMISMMFVDRRYLDEKDMEIIRSLGLQFRGKNAWPLFRSAQPGCAPWFLEKEEAVFLTAVVQQSLVLAREIREKRLDTSKKPVGAVLTRCFRDGQWRGEWRVPEPPKSTSSGTVDPRFTARLKALRSRGGRPGGLWEMDIFMMPLPIGPESERPYYPVCFMVVDQNTGLIIHVEMTEPWMDASKKQDEVIKILERTPGLPAKIRVKSDRVRRILAPVTGALGITITMGSLPRLEEARNELIAGLTRSGARRSARGR